MCSHVDWLFVNEEQKRVGSHDVMYTAKHGGLVLAVIDTVSVFSALALSDSVLNTGTVALLYRSSVSVSDCSHHWHLCAAIQ